MTHKHRSHSPFWIRSPLVFEVKIDKMLQNTAKWQGMSVQTEIALCSWVNGRHAEAYESAIGYWESTRWQRIPAEALQHAKTVLYGVGTYMHVFANKKKPSSHTEHSGPVNPSAHSKGMSPLLFLARSCVVGPDSDTPSASATALLRVPVVETCALLVASSVSDEVLLLSGAFPGHAFRNLH